MTKKKAIPDSFNTFLRVTAVGKAKNGLVVLSVVTENFDSSPEFTQLAFSIPKSCAPKDCKEGDVFKLVKR